MFVIVEYLQNKNISLNNTVKELWTRNTLFNSWTFVYSQYVHVFVSPQISLSKSDSRLPCNIKPIYGYD